MYVYVFVAYCMLSDLKVLCILLYLGYLLDEIKKVHIFDVVNGSYRQKTYAHKYNS